MSGGALRVLGEVREAGEESHRGSQWCRDTSALGTQVALGTRAALGAEWGSQAGARRCWQELREHRSELAAKALRERPGAACREGREDWSSHQDQCRPGCSWGSTG